jgi:hypothetical protein
VYFSFENKMSSSYFSVSYNVMLQVLTYTQSSHLTGSKVQGKEPPARHNKAGFKGKQGKRTLPTIPREKQSALELGGVKRVYEAS